MMVLQMRSSGELIGTKINTESEYNSNLRTGMELSIKKKNNGNCHMLPYSSYEPVILEKD
jgi:hypothetical protein